jgi:hypothetical protein
VSLQVTSRCLGKQYVQVAWSSVWGCVFIPDRKSLHITLFFINNLWLDIFIINDYYIFHVCLLSLNLMFLDSCGTWLSPVVTYIFHVCLLSLNLMFLDSCGTWLSLVVTYIFHVGWKKNFTEKPWIYVNLLIVM